MLNSLVLPTGGITRTRIAPTVIQISGSQLVNYIEAAWKSGDIEGIPDLDNAIVKVDHNLAFILYLIHQIVVFYTLELWCLALHLL
jgi:hypothetical protein